MPETFKKEDFLTATQLAKKLGTDKESVQKTMKNAFMRGTTFVLHGTARKYDLIYSAKWSHNTAAGKPERLRLHPLGLEKFKEMLDKGK